MDKTTRDYILKYKNEIQNNEWGKVFPISILEDYLDWDDVNDIYESLINANIYIDLETLFKQSYKFTDYILRNESLDDFEERALTQLYEETNKDLPSLFNEFTFGHISGYFQDTSWLSIEDIDMSGDTNTKPTQSTIEIVTSRYAYPIYVLRFINDDKDEELIVNIDSNNLERNLKYFPYGIGYNLSNIKNDIDTLVQAIETEIVK